MSSLSLSDLTLPIFTAGLHTLRTVLDKGATHVEEHKLDPNALLLARLYPDMFHFTRQVYVITDAARRGVDRLEGNEPSSVDDTETTFDELTGRVAKTIERVSSADRAAIDASFDREFEVDVGQKMSFTGRSFALGFAVPNFLFHVTTTYDIFRECGVVLGKRDFLGPFVAAQR